MKRIIIENTKIDEEKYKEIKHDDFWMTAEEALEKLKSLTIVKN